MIQARNVLEYKPLNEKQKTNKWNNIMRSRIAWFEHEYKRINDAASISTTNKQIIGDEIQAVAQLETSGGKCPRCSREWIEVSFNNLFGMGKYYKPNCQCYFKCPRCKNDLYDYYVTTRLRMHGYKCPFCEWILIDGDKKRHGLEYEMWYDRQYNKPKNIFKEKEK